MVKTYILSVDDLRILSGRVPDPCVYPKCSRAQVPGDYGYCGCGVHDCEKQLKYRRYQEAVKEAGMEDLAKRIAEIDGILAQRDTLNKQLTELTKRLSTEYGWKTLEMLNETIFKGRV